MSPRPFQSQRGFSLVELMTAVVIMGVLATVGVVAVRNHLDASRRTEAMAMIQSIRSAQNRYFSENRQYLDVSGTLTNYYPATSNGQKRSFYKTRAPAAAADATDAKWRLLGPVVAGPVVFGYAVTAGSANTTPTTPSIATNPNFVTSIRPWYVIQAQSNLDGDSVNGYVVATSMSSELFFENEGE